LARRCSGDRGVGQDERTKDALAAKKAAGVRLGRPTSISDAVTRQIVDWRAAGLTLRGIVERLGHEGVPTVSGRGWQISTIQRVLARAAAQLESAAG
jgi:DNA invertase Pin-like site-specific DNA recombinase